MAHSFRGPDISRRRFQGTLSAVLALSTGLLGACAAPATSGTQASLVYVGMHGPHLHAMRFDADSGKLTMIGPVADVPRPTWGVAHPTLPVLYAVNEDSKNEGSVIAFTANRESGALTRMNEVGAGGTGTTFLWLDAPSMTVLAANYSGGSTSTIAVNRDGSLGALVSTVKATGSGPHRRQTSAHSHGVVIDPSGRYALVADQGADRVFVYGFDRAAHALTPEDAAAPRAFVTPPGSGPRHLVFGANGRFVHVLNELTAEVMTLRWNAQQGQLALVQSLPTTSPDFKGAKSGSEIALGTDGRFVYYGNRGENALVVYAANPDSGELTFVQRVPSGGEQPWSFAIHPSGKWLLVANRQSNKVNVFGIDTASGRLSDTGQSVDTAAPVSITFMN